MKDMKNILFSVIIDFHKSSLILFLVPTLVITHLILNRIVPRIYFNVNIVLI